MNLDSPIETLPEDESIGTHSVGCLACTSKLKAKTIREYSEKFKEEKKKAKEEKERLKKDSQEKRKLEKEQDANSNVKPKKKRKREDRDKEPAIEVDVVKVLPSAPRYEFDNNKFRIYGHCPECKNKVSSYIKIVDVPDHVLDNLSIDRESFAKKPKPDKKKKKKAEEKAEEKSEEKEGSEAIL